MKRRSFLKSLGIGIGAVAVPIKLKDNSYEGQLNRLIDDIASDKIHSLDGTLLLKDFKDYDKMRFTNCFKANRKTNKIVQRCAKYIIDTSWGKKDNHKEYELYQRLQVKRAKLPIRKRPRPDFRKGIV